MDCEADLVQGFLIYIGAGVRPARQKSLRKGGTVTSLPEGFLAPAQLAFAALMETIEAAGLQEAVEGTGQGA